MQSKSRHEVSSYIFGPMTIIMLDASDRNMLLACKEKTQISIKNKKKSLHTKQSYITIVLAIGKEVIHTTKSLCILSRIGCLAASIAIGPFSICIKGNQSLSVLLLHSETSGPNERQENMFAYL